MNDHRLVGFEASVNKNKVYNAVLLSNNGQVIRIPFGDKRFENYQDKTRMNLYPHLIHGDKERRKRYHQRHEVFVKKRLLFTILFLILLFVVIM